MRTMNTVSKAKVISWSEKTWKSAFCSAGSSSGISGRASPRREASIPSRITRYPLPPASTTPAFLRTGFMFVVWASTSYPTRMASSSTCSTSPPSAAASTARLAARRDTVRTVPSAGFITAP